MHGTTIKIVHTCTALNASWVSSISVGRGSSWEERALCMFLLMFLMSLQVTVSKYWLRSSSCISLRCLSHKSCIAFLLTELFNICRFKQASLYVALTFFVSTSPSFHFGNKMLWTRNLGKPWMTRRSTWQVTAGRNWYSDPKQTGTQLVLWP